METPESIRALMWPEDMIARFAETNSDIAEQMRETNTFHEQRAQKLEAEAELLASRAAIPDLPLGTVVTVTAVAPDWQRACSGYPKLGIKGVISSDPRIPEGRQCVVFGKATCPEGVMELDDGSGYDVREDPITLFLPKDCFEARG